MKVRRKHIVATLALGILGLNIPVLAAVGQWSSNGSNMYYNDGNIGMGTSNPQKKLHISSNGTSLVMEGSSYTYIGWYPDSYASGRKAWTGFGNVNDNNFTIANEISGANIVLAPTNGGVGIGTNSPLRELHIKGEGAEFALEGQTHSYIEWYPDGYSAGRKAWTGFGSTVNDNFTISTSSNLVLSPGGVVIIDTTLKAKEILVKSNVWADYVFDEDYKLMPLKDVESFINENKHLPNIPSADEVINTGISVGEMQQKQMEKIEELTLYVIELAEKVNKLENDNKELATKLNY